MIPSSSDGFLSSLASRRSPNKSSRGSAKVAGVVMHYTAGGGTEGTVNWLCDPKSKVSAHFVIGRDGAIHQIVSLTEAAWHAGPSKWNGRGLLNDWTVGFEFCNRGLLHEEEGFYYYPSGGQMKRYNGPTPVFAEHNVGGKTIAVGWWEPFPEVQIAAGLELLTKVEERTGFAPKTIPVNGHDRVALPPGRKLDPGPAFPWERFSSEKTKI